MNTALVVDHLQNALRSLEVAVADDKHRWPTKSRGTAARLNSNLRMALRHLENHDLASARGCMPSANSAAWALAPRGTTVVSRTRLTRIAMHVAAAEALMNDAYTNDREV